MEGATAVTANQPHACLFTVTRTPAQLDEEGDHHTAAAKSTNEEVTSKVTLTPTELKLFRERNATAKRCSVFGQMPCPSPGFQILRDWCQSNLHKSMTGCALLGNGFFEVSFATDEGVNHALSAIHFMEGREVPLTPWNAAFSPQKPESSAALEHPLWFQFLGLGLHHRDEECLAALGSKFGQVLYFEDSATHAGRTSGPRVKVLVKANTPIPQRIVLSDIEEGIEHEYKVIVTGRPNQCAICHALGHNSRTCPANERNT